jgi:ribonuclease HI/probable phosphoglycerate mutase
VSNIFHSLTAEDLSFLRKLLQGVSNEVLTQLPDIRPEEAKKSLRNILAALGPETKAPSPGSTPQQTDDSRRGTAGKIAALSLFTDGASRGNPGLAGAGYVLLDDKGHEILSGYEFLGICTNNVAEYRALMLGLQAASGKECRDLSVFMDSELIVKQLTGEYRVKDVKLKPLFDEVRKSCALFDRCRFRHVLRSQNHRADQLANMAIDEEKDQ